MRTFHPVKLGSYEAAAWVAYSRPRRRFYEMVKGYAALRTAVAR